MSRGLKGDGITKKQRLTKELEAETMELQLMRQRIKNLEHEAEAKEARIKELEDQVKETEAGRTTIQATCSCVVCNHVATKPVVGIGCEASKPAHQKSKNYKVAEDVAIVVAYMATYCGADGRRNKEMVHESFEFITNMMSNEVKEKHTHAENISEKFPKRAAKSVSRRVEIVVKSRILTEAMRQEGQTTPIDLDNFNIITVLNVYNRYTELATAKIKDVYIIPKNSFVRYTNIIKQNSNRNKATTK